MTQTSISIKVIPDGMSGSMLTSVRVIKNDNELDSEVIEIKPTGYLNLPNVAATVCSYYQLKVEHDELVFRLHEIEPKYEVVRAKYTELLPQGSYSNKAMTMSTETPERSLKDEFQQAPEAPSVDVISNIHATSIQEPVHESKPEPKPESIIGRVDLAPPPAGYFNKVPEPTQEPEKPKEVIKVAAERAPLHLMSYKEQAKTIWEDVYSALKTAGKTQFEEIDLMAEAARCGVREENIDGVVQELIYVFQEKNATVEPQKQESTISKLLGGKKNAGKKKSTK